MAAVSAVCYDVINKEVTIAIAILNVINLE
jgi:hypothetical protein